MTEQATKSAADLIPGVDWAVERDGCEWLVSAVEPVGKTKVRITLKNEHRYMSAGRECTQTLKRTTQVRVRSTDHQG